MNTQLRKNNGFTLIELIVVVSIIALLSSIILTNLATSRAQAENAKIKVQAKSISNAIYLARDPITGVWPGYTGPSNTYVCLKKGSSTCFGGNLSNSNDTVYNKITTYMPSLPLVSNSLFPSGTLGNDSYIYMPYFNATSIGGQIGAYLFWGQTVYGSGNWCDGTIAGGSIGTTESDGVTVNYYCYQFLGSD